MSVNDIFSAENKCDVYFYKLKDAVNNVFSVDRSEQVIGFKLILDSDVLEANDGHVIEFLKSKIKGKSYNEPIKLYCLKKDNGDILCIGGPKKINSLNKEFTDTVFGGPGFDEQVKNFINEVIEQNGSLNVYFYATQKHKNHSKEDKGKSSKNRKCCCC